MGIYRQPSALSLSAPFLPVTTCRSGRRKTANPVIPITNAPTCPQSGRDGKMIGRKKIRTCITLAAIPQPLAEGCSFQIALHAAPRRPRIYRKQVNRKRTRRERSPRSPFLDRATKCWKSRITSRLPTIWTQLREAARWSFRTCCYSGKSRLIEVSKSRCRLPRLSV